MVYKLFDKMAADSNDYMHANTSGGAIKSETMPN